MSIESIKARLEAHDQQRERFGYCDETAPQTCETDLRVLLAVAEAAKEVCVPKFNDKAKRADWDALFAAIDELEKQP